MTQYRVLSQQKCHIPSLNIQLNELHIWIYKWNVCARSRTSWWSRTLFRFIHMMFTIWSKQHGKMHKDSMPYRRTLWTLQRDSVTWATRRIVYLPKIRKINFQPHSDPLDRDTSLHFSDAKLLSPMIRIKNYRFQVKTWTRSHKTTNTTFGSSSRNDTRFASASCDRQESWAFKNFLNRLDEQISPGNSNSIKWRGKHVQLASECARECAIAKWRLITIVTRLAACVIDHK